ncbi:unnamed protein product [Closterium sp. NIES-64]|nr:unnamed protein product [Closterium sp. NIES-64]
MSAATQAFGAVNSEERAQASKSPAPGASIHPSAEIPTIAPDVVHSSAPAVASSHAPVGSPSPAAEGAISTVPVKATAPAHVVATAHAPIEAHPTAPAVAIPDGDSTHQLPSATTGDHNPAQAGGKDQCPARLPPPRAGMVAVNTCLQLLWVPRVAGIEFEGAGGGAVMAQYPPLLPADPPRTVANDPLPFLVGGGGSLSH